MDLFGSFGDGPWTVGAMNQAEGIARLEVGVSSAAWPGRHITTSPLRLGDSAANGDAPDLAGVPLAAGSSVRSASFQC